MRYSRQQLFKSIGETGQQKLQQKHVLIVGAGALGSAAAEMLVRAGVGEISIVDRDYVDWSNLQRQQLYKEQDAKQQTPKVIAAKNRLKEVNSEVEVREYIMDVQASTLEELVSGIDLIIDGTDNFDTRLVINDIAQKHSIPWIYGSCVSSFGMTYTILPGKTPCLHCLLKVIPSSGMTCDSVGIISPAVQIVAAYQVAEALKVLVEDLEAVRKGLFTFDVWKNQHYTMGVQQAKSKHCPSCGKDRSYPYLSYEYETKTEALCGRNTVQIRPAKKEKVDLNELATKLSTHGKVNTNPYLVSLHLPNYRLVFFLDGRVFVHGTNSIVEAKKLYYQFLG
ncbi:MoeB/ThiF family adenylyltransferase [Bacillus sp. FJAT-45066]|uniref:MoeB/ThiF family adenylyltransferase n=1 Tax=Bacillus sp. FJAT-45066 TaxID=2011010 RepID=UPI000BB970A5|nr:MoeB/ThiF family adenylyltransferase [Bacillus sp. FJAT-45066]